MNLISKTTLAIVAFGLIVSSAPTTWAAVPTYGKPVLRGVSRRFPLTRYQRAMNKLVSEVAAKAPAAFWHLNDHPLMQRSIEGRGTDLQSDRRLAKVAKWGVIGVGLVGSYLAGFLDARGIQVVTAFSALIPHLMERSSGRAIEHALIATALEQGLKLEKPILKRFHSEATKSPWIFGAPHHQHHQYKGNYKSAIDLAANQLKELK